MSKYQVAIVGRPNVGKSTLFNRLIEKRDAIVADISGVTRDRNYGECFWNGYHFKIIDTGGFVPDNNMKFNAEVAEQVMFVLNSADCILFVVDVDTGITSNDMKIYEMLRKEKKDYYLIINKVDNHEKIVDTYEFYKLTNRDFFPVSATSGYGTGELLDAIALKISQTSKEKKEGMEEQLPRFAIVGKPNVGKSSFLNVILDEKRSIVTDVPGTTRDSIDMVFNRFQKNIILVDTAGLRKNKKIKENIEFYSTLRTQKAIEESDVCIFLFDVREGLTAQDMDIFQTIIYQGKGVVFVANKWDLIKKETNTYIQYEKDILKKVKPFSDIPLFFASTVERKNLLNILDEAIKVYERRNSKLSTSKLNKLMQKIILQTPPPTYRGNAVKMNYISQLKTNHASFVIFCNHPDAIKQPYKNYIENSLRKEFDLKGVPIRIFFRKK